jgi:hypothetical protein
LAFASRAPFPASVGARSIIDPITEGAMKIYRLEWGALFAALALVFAVPNVASAASGTYYFKHFTTTGGSDTSWYTNDNSWGVNSADANGFTVMVNGEDWGARSPVTGYPKRLSAVNPGNNSWFSQTSSPRPGVYYDATYDIFIDPTAAPTNRNSQNELMIWLNWSNAQPLSDCYDASGSAVPTRTNASLGGRTWDIYTYSWPSGGHTISYLDTGRSGWWSGSLSPFLNWGVSNGYYTSSQYLNSVMAGWEYGPGTYTATSWGAVGF